MIAFTHEGKSFSLGPSDLVHIYNDLNESIEKTNNSINKSTDTKFIKSKLFVIDGALHTLYEKPVTKPGHNLQSGEAICTNSHA